MLTWHYARHECDLLGTSSIQTRVGGDTTPGLHLSISTLHLRKRRLQEDKELPQGHATNPRWLQPLHVPPRHTAYAPYPKGKKTDPVHRFLTSSASAPRALPHPKRALAKSRCSGEQCWVPNLHHREAGRRTNISPSLASDTAPPVLLTQAGRGGPSPWDCPPPRYRAGLLGCCQLTLGPSSRPSLALSF